MLFQTSFLATTTSLLSLFLSLAASQGSGVSSQVPPPACLRDCMTTVGGDCSLCTDAGSAAVTQCIDSTCGPKDVSYASAYYSSICPDGGYMSYATSPPHFVDIPPAPEDCVASSKRAISFEG